MSDARDLATTRARDFDVLLVLNYFRSATPYLSIIKHLSSELRIGVIPAGRNAALEKKTGEAAALFLRLCTQFGAEIVRPDSALTAKVLIVQQFPYEDESADTLRQCVSSKRRIGLLALALAGLEPHDKFLAQFEIQKVFVPSSRFMAFLLNRRDAVSRYRGLEVEEVGLPYEQYPVFPEFSVDWLIAAPTLFSFSSEAGKQEFLEDVLSLIAQIPPNETVAYKPHNGNQLDYFAPRAHRAVAALFTALPDGCGLLRAVSRVGPRGLRREVGRVLTCALHRRVLRRAVPMNQLTPYADMSLEAFLPGVRRGVIGGLSNTVWGTLYFRRQFFNCVDPSLVHHGPSELLNKSSEPLLQLNLEFFGVPYCHGSLQEGADGRDIVLDSDRAGDLIRAVKREVQAAA